MLGIIGCILIGYGIAMLTMDKFEAFIVKRFPSYAAKKCWCISYHERTGIHVDDCPRKSIEHPVRIGDKRTNYDV